MSEIQSNDGEKEIFCVQKTLRAPAAFVQLRDLNLRFLNDCSPGGRRSAAADGEYDAILADPRVDPYQEEKSEAG